MAAFLPEPASALVVRPLDDITLIYHRPSGQTHLTVSPVPEMLASLREAGAPLTPEQLVERLSARFDLGEAVEAEAAIAAHLDELAALGLVRRA